METPFIDGILGANQRQVAKAIELVEASGLRKVALVGLSFKPDTDDLRNSPCVELAVTLLERGYDLTVVDRNVPLAGLLGANKAFSTEKLPYLEDLLVADGGDAIAASELLIVADRRQAEEYIVEIEQSRPHVIDLVRSSAIAALDLDYEGICW